MCLRAEISSGECKIRLLLNALPGCSETYAYAYAEPAPAAPVPIPLELLAAVAAHVLHFVFHSFPHPFGIGDKLIAANLSSGIAGEIFLDGFADHPSRIPVSFEGSGAFAVFKPVMNAFHAGFDFFYALGRIAEPRQGQAQVQPRQMIVFVESQGVLERLARLGIFFCCVLAASQIGPDAFPEKIIFVDILGSFFAASSKYGKARSGSLTKSARRPLST